jgi:hypothetical protein
MPLPARCPELNPIENVWQFLRGNWLSNRVFTCLIQIKDRQPKAPSRVQAVEGRRVGDGPL